MWYVVHVTDTGEAFSFGTILSEEMPSEFSARTLSEDETTMLLDGTGIWDASLLAVVPRG